MTGGSLSLTSTRGLGQDVININPQITFFKKVYKRHTNFGIESIQQELGSLDFGGSDEINITKTGTLITDIHFEFTLPSPAGKDGKKADDKNALTNDNDTHDGCVDNYLDYARWVNAVGFAIINEIQLKFGSNIIDKHTGLWYDVWNELTDPNGKEWPLVGKFNESEMETNMSLKSRYYLPLKFYFNRNPGLALPIFLLNENELKIKITLNSLASLLLFKKQPAVTPVINSKSLESPKLFANYVFLEAEEESRIQNSLPSEYLVETLDIQDLASSGDATGLVFENPTKEFIWVFRHNDRLSEGSATVIPRYNSSIGNDTNPNDVFNYSLAGQNTSLNYGTKDTFDSLKILINNKERFSDTDATFFRTMQPYKYHSNIPGGIRKDSKKQYIYVYSFALNPEEYQPTGSYNFSIGDDLVKFEFTGANADYKLTIFSLRYEYLVFNYGRVTVSRVPIQTSFQEAQVAVEADAGADDGDDAKKQAKRKAIKTKSQKSSAVKQEIRRRYATEVPYLHEQSLGKKKWSGLQGDFFQKEKMDGLDKEYELKKKNIF